MTQVCLQRIDELNLSKHPYLESEDKCYYLGEYAGRQGYDHSCMNQLIQNFKKPIDRKNKPEWKYKEQAIEKIAKYLLNLKAWNQIKDAAWVPIPPSKTKKDPGYDPRLLQVLNKMKTAYPDLNVKDLIYISEGRSSAHDGARRPTVEDLYKNFIIDENASKREEENIIIFDDVITTGASFKAGQRRIKEVFPAAKVVGIFIARSIITNQLII